MLGGARILVVEDEALTALDIADEIQAAGGRVVGPFASVALTLAALERAEVAAAILDANLIDRDVTPVAIVLIARHVPVAIHSGTGLPEELRRLFPDLPVILEPTASCDLIRTLEMQIRPQ